MFTFQILYYQMKFSEVSSKVHCAVILCQENKFHILLLAPPVRGGARDHSHSGALRWLP